VQPGRIWWACDACANCEASARTIARWLAQDAIRRCQHQACFPADPRFAEHAGPVLELYERRWEGQLRATTLSRPTRRPRSRRAPAFTPQARRHPGR
jgi:hypothetical protein